jgi:hypothetical protein
MISSSHWCRRTVMFKLFTNMMKEEWRIHSTIFGSLSFALFPVMIFGIAFMGSFLLPLFRAVIPGGDLSTIIHALFLLLGIMVGAFGLIGQEAMNRRFGQASLLAYSARSLPISVQEIFCTFVVKDTVYYFFLWVLPFVGGFAIASPFIGIPLSLPALLLLTLTLAFLTGLSVVFFLSTVYARSKPALGVILALLLISGAGLYLFAGINIALFFPPLMLFYSFSWVLLGFTCAVILCLSTVAVLLFTSEYTDTTRRHSSALAPLAQRLSFFPYPPLAAKDLIDLSRSGSFIGQTIFSFLIPLGLLWFLLSVLTRLLPSGGVLLLFAILTGVIASTMYTWITAFDSYNSYTCLPVSVRALLTSKMCSFTVLQLIPVALIIIVSLLSNGVAYLIPALVLCLSVSFFSLAVTVWLTGLSPSVMVYDVKVLVTYLFVLGIALIVLIALSFMNPYYSLASVLLFLPGWLFFRESFVKWDSLDQPTF